MKIHLFVTCLNDALFPQTGIAVTEVLERLGHVVIFDERQTCCGQMHLNSGYRADALAIARHWMDVFAGVEAVVAPSGSCVAHLRELVTKIPEWSGDAALSEAMHSSLPPVYEFAEFLLSQKVTDVGASFAHRVTYHPACHGTRALHLGMSPLTLLQHVRGIELLELSHAEQCCGFGGTFSIKNSDTSGAMLADKLRSIADSGTEFVTAIDNSCLMHIGGGLRKLGLAPKAIHLAEILASQEAR